MLGFMLTELAKQNGADWVVRTAGTHVVEGQAISQRTLEALAKVEDLGEHHFTAHRSHQLSDEDVSWADVIVTVEADHVAYVHARYPAAHDKVVQLRLFCATAPLDGALVEQVRIVASRTPDDVLDVADPAGGDLGAYDQCAQELWELAQVFATLAVGETHI